MGVILESRRERTSQRLEALKAELPVSRHLAEGKACVYATGSFARGEASKQSDLDLFIVGKSKKVEATDANHKHQGSERLLRRLDEIRIKAELIEVTKRLEIPEFSGDGEYLKHYTVNELVGTLGRPEDDVTNTFTARLLLLLESKPLVDIRGAVVQMRAEKNARQKVQVKPTVANARRTSVRAQSKGRSKPVR